MDSGKPCFFFVCSPAKKLGVRKESVLLACRSLKTQCIFTIEDMGARTARTVLIGANDHGQFPAANVRCYHPPSGKPGCHFNTEACPCALAPTRVGSVHADTLAIFSLPLPNQQCLPGACRGLLCFTGIFDGKYFRTEGVFDKTRIENFTSAASHA